MKSLFEVMNIDLAQEYTKERKKEAATSLNLDGDLYEDVFAAINDMDIPDNDERHHWIQRIGNTMAADLLTIGKVQPENMLAASSLSKDDFQEAVKIAVKGANDLNQFTVAAEQAIKADVITDKIV
tara:strand:+ start:25 stop:402 length:378 start_codon:yes stop_codon:yes gene_type:complete